MEDDQVVDYKRCPVCGNEQLKIYEQRKIGVILSARTRRVLKHEGYLDTECWNYFCNCGWEGEMITQ
jgi:hypothetical protein